MITEKHIADQVTNDSKRGYWSVNNKYFFNKHECMSYASSIQDTNIKFHYFDDFYKSLNWEVEPSESLKELYKRRAQSLRDKYDYIILAFSGGADSTNILNSFIDNGIHLDEVITVYPKTMMEKYLDKFDRSNTFHGNMAFEYYEAALPTLKNLSIYHPEIIISDFDSTSLADEIVLSGKMMDYTQYGFPPTVSLVSSYIRMYTRVREVSDTGKRVCYLTGADKPRIAFSPTKKVFATFFQDISFFFGSIEDSVLSGFKPTTESFYYNQDVPELQIKQCAIIKRVLQPIFENNDQVTIAKNKLIQFTAPNGSQIVDVHGNFVKKLLYPDWDTSIFQAEKPPNPSRGGPGYLFLHTDFFDKRFQDFADSQITEYYQDLDNNVVLKDPKGLPREKFYTTDPIVLKF